MWQILMNNINNIGMYSCMDIFRPYKISWITTSPVSTARIRTERGEGGEDDVRKLTAKEWSSIFNKSSPVTKITITQPYGFLDNRLMGQEFGRSVEMPSNSTVREILTAIKKMTTYKPGQSTDHVAFAGLRKSRNGNYTAIIDSWHQDAFGFCPLAQWHHFSWDWDCGGRGVGAEDWG